MKGGCNNGLIKYNPGCLPLYYSEEGLKRGPERIVVVKLSFFVKWGFIIDSSVDPNTKNTVLIISLPRRYCDVFLTGIKRVLETVLTDRLTDTSRESKSYHVAQKI